MVDQLSTDYKKLVRNAWRLFYLSQKAWAASIEDAGLTTASFPVLETIVQNPGITQQEITDQVSLDKSCTSRACKALESGGFIRREKSLQSAHAFRCYPTEKSPAIVESIVKKECQLIQDRFGDQHPEELARASALLAELIEKMRKA